MLALGYLFIFRKARRGLGAWEGGGKYVVSKSVNRGRQKIAGARSWGLDHLDVEVLEVFVSDCVGAVAAG